MCTPSRKSSALQCDTSVTVSTDSNRATVHKPTVSENSMLGDHFCPIPSVLLSADQGMAVLLIGVKQEPKRKKETMNRCIISVSG